MKANTIKCDGCQETYDFIDDAEDGMGSAECMPDGTIFQGKWFCMDCITVDDGNDETHVMRDHEMRRAFNLD